MSSLGSAAARGGRRRSARYDDRRASTCAGLGVKCHVHELKRTEATLGSHAPTRALLNCAAKPSRRLPNESNESIVKTMGGGVPTRCTTFPRIVGTVASGNLVSCDEHERKRRARGEQEASKRRARGAREVGKRCAQGGQEARARRAREAREPAVGARTSER